MSTISPLRLLPAPAPLADPAVYRITVYEYERMADMLDDPRVELIDGYLVRKMGKKPPHVWAVDCAEEQMKSILAQGWYVRTERPVRIPKFDEPEPDIAVVKGTRRDYRKRHPEPKDVSLIVEVAESSLGRDRGEKRAAYSKGRHPIPVYWIVNLVDRQVELYTNAGPAGYQSRQDFGPGEYVPVVIDGIEVGRIAVDSILP
jgi:Uma2 family endonuclease